MLYYKCPKCGTYNSEFKVGEDERINCDYCCSRYSATVSNKLDTGESVSEDFEYRCPT